MDRPTPVSPTLAAMLAEMLKDHGVERMFGIPGGGSSLALIEAAGRAGLDFVLTRTETAAAIMAAVTGELTASPGVLLTGIGPGAASAVNGIAYASLEKAPVILITDGPASSPHQAFDQNALYRPITKLQGRVRPEDGAETFARAIETALTPPWGPVHLDLSAGDATAAVFPNTREALDIKVAAPPKQALADARALLAASRKPVIVAGLEARHGTASQALRRIAGALACPVLTTYKASGVLPASHSGFAGLFTGAVAEQRIIRTADLIVLFGFDAIEMVPGPWPYDGPVLDICLAEATPLPVEPRVRVAGELTATAGALLPGLAPSGWRAEEIAAARRGMVLALDLGGSGHTAQSVIEAAARLAPTGARLTVDAGAHMFSALARWPAEEPFGVLKSNGLSTMGFALPAAIASSLEEPGRPAIAVTGDGGMTMSLGDLATAAEHGCNVTAIVINDAALSLIDIKQQRQQYESRGVRYPPTDFARAAQAFGCRAWRVEADGDIEPALTKALAHDGPAVVDVTVNPDGYGEQLVRLRG